MLAEGPEVAWVRRFSDNIPFVFSDSRSGPKGSLNTDFWNDLNSDEWPPIEYWNIEELGAVVIQVRDN